MDRLTMDVRYAIRMLLRNPGVSAVAVLALALGIGANTATFSVVDSILLRPLPFDDLDGLLMISQIRADRQSDETEMAPGNFIDLRDRNHVFEHVAAWDWWNVNLSGAGGLRGDALPERVQGFIVTPSFFQALRVAPALGRTFLPEEDQPGHDQVAVLSHTLWRDRFASDPGVLGRTIRLNSVPHTIVGVMPEGFQFPPGGPDLWAPLTLDRTQQQSRGSRFLSVFGRLKPGVSPRQAQADAEALGALLAKDHPDSNHGWGFSVAPLVDFVIRHSRPILLTLTGAVSFVLLIACANVANLLLSRALSRQKEIAIRAAMGASRLRVIRQLLTESVVLALIGGAAGLLVAQWGVELMRASLPPEVVKFVPGWTTMRIGGPVLAFTLGISVLTGILFGLVPALQASRPDLNETLKESGRKGAGGSGRHNLRGALVVAEIALAMMLLIGAALSVRGFQSLVGGSLGLRPDNVLTAQITLAGADYPEPARIARFYQQLLERVEALPGVESAGTISNLPLSGSRASSGITIDGRAATAPSERPTAIRYHVSSGYFRAMGIPLIRGRELTEQDSAEAEPVALVSEKMARLYWAGEDPIGRRFSMGGTEADPGWITIVGIVGDARSSGLDAEPLPTMYLHHLQSPRPTMSLVARTSTDPMGLAGAIGGAVRSLDAGLPVYNIREMNDVLGNAMAGPRFSMRLLGVLACVALFLASIGIYGVMASSVTQRTHEIGIRMALGAQKADVLAMTMGHGLRLTMIGVGLGMAGAYGLTRLISAAVFWMRPTDLLAFTAIPMLLAAVSLMATWLPARRATRVDPMVALRHE